MRRERRINKDDDMGIKVIKYASIGVAVLTIVVFGLLWYSKSLNDEVKQGSLTTEQIASIMNKTNTQTESQAENQTESASTEIGKSVDEASNEMIQNEVNDVAEQNVSNTTNSTNKTSNSNNTTTNLTTNTLTDTTKSTNANSTNKTSQNIANSSTSNATETNVENKSENKELSFIKPVEGEVVREFAKENLIYSETLQEWTTHLGVDIKAEKTTVVKSAEAGTVKTIKNDPRYGLTIVVEHEGGYQTVYANLLTSEFVVEGENVDKGQSLGTVGNTAVFEIVDEPHLHFEILKDSVAVDPNLYLK